MFKIHPLTPLGLGRYSISEGHLPK